MDAIHNSPATERAKIARLHRELPVINRCLDSLIAANGLPELVGAAQGSACHALASTGGTF